ncbi:ATP-dependent helicase [Bacillus nitratireducens]|uniref:ATP-dependent helicase n=1 Tax=Bacillus nitratireducens TaxID=2026193 RepID=UPI003399F58B
MDNYLSNQQLEVVNHKEGPILVMAGPGSGKTTLLTKRIKNLLVNKKESFRILVITFNKRAANNIKERLSKEIVGLEEKSYIGTIYQFCLEILRNHGEVVGINKEFILLQEEERINILKKIIYSNSNSDFEINFAGNSLNGSTSFIREVLGFISDNKREFKSPDLFNKYITDKTSEEELLQILYKDYEFYLRSHNLIDFDDLKFLTYRIFTERPAVKKFYQRLYKYICIDEGQDLDYSAYNIIKALVNDGHKNIMIMGDQNQAIYSFMGGSGQFLNDFRNDFSPQEIVLEQNYRSSYKIISLSKKLMPNLVIKGTFPRKGDVIMKKFYDEYEEANWVVNNLIDLIKHGHSEIDKNLELSDFAVIGRNRRVLKTVKELLDEKGIPNYTQISSDFESESRLMQLFEIGIRILVNPNDKYHLNQLKDILMINLDIDYFENQKISSSGFELLTFLKGYIDKGEISNNYYILLKAWEELECKDFDFDLSLDILQTNIKENSDLNEEQIYLALNDIETWRTFWREYIAVTEKNDYNLGTFRNRINLIFRKKNQIGIGLLTVHTSKGLEFEVVHIIGLNDGIFPSYYGDIEEERRILYVAISRARRLLYLSYTKTRQLVPGKIRAAKPSKFLSDLDLIN